MSFLSSAVLVGGSLSASTVRLCRPVERRANRVTPPSTTSHSTGARSKAPAGNAREAALAHKYPRREGQDSIAEAGPLVSGGPDDVHRTLAVVFAARDELSSHNRAPERSTRSRGERTWGSPATHLISRPPAPHECSKSSPTGLHQEYRGGGRPARPAMRLHHSRAGDDVARGCPATMRHKSFVG